MRIALLCRTAVCVVAILAALPALAQQHQQRLEDIAPGVEWFTGSKAEALEKAKEQNRLLVIYYWVPGSQNAAWMEEYTWRNPTLAAYIRWHCIAIKQRISNEHRMGVAVFKDGRQVASVCCKNTGLSDSGLGPMLTSGRQMLPPADVCPGAVNVLFQTDFALERIKATDPAWHMLHEHKNPAPEAPPMPRGFYKTEDDLGQAVEDPPLDAGPIDLWERLESARRAVRAGNLHAATGLYTWLWERAGEVDPAFGPARRWFIGAEIADLVSKRKPAEERFTKIRNAHGSRLLWAEYDELLEWGMLGSIVNDDGLTVEWFDVFINSDAEAAMLPRADKIAYELMLSRSRFANPWELGKDPVGRVERISRLASGGMPRLVQKEDWPRLQAFLAAFRLEEGSRLHAACLAAGREEEARRIADLVLKADGSAAARRTLVTTALVAGQARAMHLELLGEGGDADPQLRTKIREAIDARGVGGAAAPAAVPSPGSSPR